MAVPSKAIAAAESELSLPGLFIQGREGRDVCVNYYAEVSAPASATTSVTPTR